MLSQRFFFALCVLLLLSLGSACVGPSDVPPTIKPTLAFPTPTNRPVDEAGPQAPVATLSAAQHLLSLMPACDGLEILAAPVKFEWPNINQRLEELAGSQWGYYRCPAPVADVAAFYKRTLPQSPYGMRETNWVDISDGSLGLYYHPAYQLWFYVWVVPPPGSQLSAYVIVSRSDALAFEPEC
jgi:hypothetical protein